MIFQGGVSPTSCVFSITESSWGDDKHTIMGGFFYYKFEWRFTLIFQLPTFLPIV